MALAIIAPTAPLRTRRDSGKGSLAASRPAPVPITIAADMVAPFCVYVNGDCIADFGNDRAAAEALYTELRAASLAAG